tara:strand:+ start:394 stop:537 length:144 start_codon:yes stop_codon:yes gene_type:complete
MMGEYAMLLGIELATLLEVEEVESSDERMVALWACCDVEAKAVEAIS